MSFIKKLLIGNKIEKTIKNRVYKKHLDNLNAIWNNTNYNDVGIERLLRLFLQCLAFILPVTLLRHLAGYSHNYIIRRLIIEFYTISKPLLYLLYFKNDLTTSLPIVIISILQTTDTIYFLLSRLFLNDILKEPISHKRSLILTFVNFIEMCLFFAFIYSFIDDSNMDPTRIIFQPGHLTDLQTIYFSFVTSATIGYGDITPKDNTLMFIVILQILISLFFVVVFVTNIVGKVDRETSFTKQTK